MNNLVELAKQIQDRCKHEQYVQGMIEGMTRYAWWKDGVQYVGTCGKTLKDAIEEVKQEYKPR